MYFEGIKRNKVDKNALEDFDIDNISTKLRSEIIKEIIEDRYFFILRER
jgi:hypothetical protein